MAECLYGIPAIRGGCQIANPGWQAQPLLVTAKGDGTMLRVVPATRTALGQPSDPWDFSQEGRFSYDAMLSAWEMLDEHDQRIRDAGQIPSNIGRQPLWRSYYQVSKKQFADDDVKLRAGKPPQIIFSEDGIPTFSPQRLYERNLHRGLLRELTTEERELAEIVAYYGTTKTAAQISAVMPLDPLHRKIVQDLIDRELADSPIRPVSPLPPAGTVTGIAPAPSPGRTNTFILRDPSLPAVASNMLGTQEMIDRERRQWESIISGAPEYYRDDEAEVAEWQAELRDYFYWKANYPTCRLWASQNPGIQPPSVLADPWPGGDSPLVLVEITPRTRPKPELGFLAKNPWLGAVASLIPFVGGIIGAGLSYAANDQLKKWAGSWKPNASEFAPQFDPRPFQVPMPLDRAQIMVREPWYAPAMVDQFAEEIRTNTLRQASEAYAALFAAMGASGQNPLTSASALSTVQGAASLGTPITNYAQAPSGSAFPFFLAGALLVAGAPVVLPIAVVVLMSKKS